MSGTYRFLLLRRIGWSLAGATLWVWGLLGLRMIRDGLLPLEVWYSYSLSFFMTAVYCYLGQLIYRAARIERLLQGPRSAEGAAPSAVRGFPGRVAVYGRAAGWLGLAGLAIAVVSLSAWLILRFPGPQSVPGTISSVVLALMVLGVAVVATLICRPLDQEPG